MGAGQGNLTEPLPLVERHGADAVRWYLAALSPGRRNAPMSDAAIAASADPVLRTYWHCVRHYQLHADETTPPDATRPDATRPDATPLATTPLDATRLAATPLATTPLAATPPVPTRPVLDRWLLSELQLVVSDVTQAFDRFRPDVATRRLARYIRDLSRWYLRLSRGRPVEPPAANLATTATLRECLGVLTRLTAPVAPFLSEYAWHLVRPCDAAESVHQAPWPRPVPQLLDEPLNAQLVQVRRIITAGRSARASARIGARQPLSTAVISPDQGSSLSDQLLALIAHELNVKQLQIARPPTDWPAARSAGGMVALDPTLTCDLIAEGLARWAVRIINEARKQAGLSYRSRIELRWATADSAQAAAFEEHGAAICLGTRSTRFEPVAPDAADLASYREVTGRGTTFWLRPH